MKISELLWKARDVLISCGHTKRELKSESGAVCAIGAMNQVLTGDARTWLEDIDSYHMNDRDILNNAVSLIEDNFNIFSLIAWNNREERTPTEVIDIFASAARVAESCEAYEKE